MTATLNPDRAALERFAAAIFKNADPRGFISLRAFPDKGSKQEKPIFIDPYRVDDSGLIDNACERARQAAAWIEPAVFCPPAATFQTFENAKTENLLEGVALSVECDAAPSVALTRLTDLLGDATMVVASGGEWQCPETGEIQPKLHLHWRLKAPSRTLEEHKLLREARELATALVGGDATNKSIVHPIRWPGSWHRKKSPRLATIEASSDREIDLLECLAVLRDATGMAGAEHKASGKRRAADDAYVQSALAAIPNDNLAWDDWNKIGMATWAATDGSEAGREAFAKWSAKAPKNDPAATEARWQHYKTSPPSQIGFGTLVYLARKYSPGWSFGEAANAVEPVDLWAKFDPPTLPRGVLPRVIEDFAFDQGMTMGCDMSGLAVGALAVCAAAIPDRIQLQPKRHDKGWLESARLWVAVVGPPSTMKTPMLSAATRPLRSIDSRLAKANHQAMAEYNKLSKDDKQQREIPKQPRLMIQDVTIEAAQEILKDSPNGVLCYQDELSGWFGSIDKYSSARGSAKDRGFWLQSYNGGEYSANRIGRGSVFIENLSVSVVGGIQPGPIRKLAEESVDDGLLQRLIPIILQPAVMGRDEQQSEAAADYARLIESLHYLQPPISNGGGIMRMQTCLRFDDGALAIREGLERRHLELLQCETINPKLGAHLGKYNGLFARLCIVWHCVEHAGGELPAIITEATARRAKAFLHGFLLPHALAFYAGVLGLANDHDRLTAVAGYILAHKLERVTNRDVQRGDRSMRKLERQDTDRIFEQLDALGWVSRTPGPRPSDASHWLVNPLVHQRFAERGKAEAERRERERSLISGLMQRGTAA